jgi:hypothetical protein
VGNFTLISGRGIATKTADVVRSIPVRAPVMKEARKILLQFHQQVFEIVSHLMIHSPEFLSNLGQTITDSLSRYLSIRTPLFIGLPTV